MNNTWILDVLKDLKIFTSMNALKTLENEFDCTHRVASAELDALIERPILGSKTEHRGRGPQSGRVGTRFRASRPADGYRQAVRGLQDRPYGLSLGK